MSDYYIPVSNNQPTKIFFTSLGEMQNAESMNIINLLANKVFKDQIISIDNIVTFAPAMLGLYNFN